MILIVQVTCRHTDTHRHTHFQCLQTYPHLQCFPQGLTTGGAGGCGLGVVNVHIKAFHANLNTHQRISINLSRVAHPAKRLWGKHCSFAYTHNYSYDLYHFLKSIQLVLIKKITLTIC